MLRGPRWRRTTPGFYVPASGVPSSSAQRIVEAVAAAPDGSVVGGWAAAYMLGVDRLDGLNDHTRRPVPVRILLPPNGRRRNQPGVHYLQQRVNADEVVDVAGIAVTCGVRTALDLARSALSLTEAVVALDAAIHAKIVSKDLLTAGLSNIRGARGSRRATRAVDLSRPGVLSNWETRLRMVYVLELGFNTPLVNVPVFNSAGIFVGVPDLLDEEAGLVLEYDGTSWSNSRRPDGHRDVDQHREDNVREELLERTRLIVVRADKKDITRYRARLLVRLSSAREEGLNRDRRRDAWTLEPPRTWLGLPA